MQTLEKQVSPQHNEEQGAFQTFGEGGGIVRGDTWTMHRSHGTITFLGANEKQLVNRH